MLHAAIEIDPLYAFPRCNLALYLLDEDDVEGATEMLAPLTQATQFHAQEMAFYSYTQARLLLARGEYESARRTLEMALQVWPDSGPAKDLLERLETTITLRTGFDSLVERMHQRDLARRERLQTRLSTSDPSLAEALSLYTKDVLTGMGRVLLPWGGWSALRKAELVEQILAGLDDADNIADIVSDLNEEECDALRQVLEHGGHMPWQDFDTRFGNDLEESPHWQYHEPETVMGRLRLRGLLVETTVDGELLIAVPSDLRRTLAQALD
jgi:tetratricopeptide (TPR) repeat protein